MKDGFLWWFFENLVWMVLNNWWFWIPKTGVLYGVHESIGGGHLEVEKSVAKLKERFCCPGHYSDVQNWCATCSSCIARKTTQPHQRNCLQPVNVGYPLQMVAVNIFLKL